MEINIKLNQEEIEPIRSKILRKAAGNRPKADYSTVEERNAFLQGYAVGVRSKPFKTKKQRHWLSGKEVEVIDNG